MMKRLTILALGFLTSSTAQAGFVTINGGQGMTVEYNGLHPKGFVAVYSKEPQVLNSTIYQGPGTIQVKAGGGTTDQSAKRVKFL